MTLQAEATRLADKAALISGEQRTALLEDRYSALMSPVLLILERNLRRCIKGGRGRGGSARGGVGLGEGEEGAEGRGAALMSPMLLILCRPLLASSKQCGRGA